MTSALQEWRRLAPSPRKLEQGQAWHVFLSYRSVNRPWVINLYDVLRDHEHRVFLDQIGLRGGMQLVSQLQDELMASQAGVLVWSTAAVDSEWVRQEYGVMHQRAMDEATFCFVPVRLDRAELPPFAKNWSFRDFTDYPDGPNGRELLQLLHAVVGQPLSEEASHFASEHDEVFRNTQARITAAVANGDEVDLRRMFDHGGLAWETSAVLGCKAAEGLIRLGLPEQALIVLRCLRGQFPRAIRPRQLEAHALARRDDDTDLNEAQRLLGELYAEQQRDPETLGIYASTWMRRFRRTGNVLHLRRSRDLYAEAFAGAQDDYYTGINAATKSLLLGDTEASTAYASLVEAAVGSEPVPGDYWRTATAAEAQLLQRRYGAAARLYECAVAAAPEELGSHRTTYAQVNRLLDALGAANTDRQMVDVAFAHLQQAAPTDG